MPQTIESADKNGNSMTIINYSDDLLSDDAIRRMTETFLKYSEQSSLKFSIEIHILKFSERPVFASWIATVPADRDLALLYHTLNESQDEIAVESLAVALAAAAKLQDDQSMYGLLMQAADKLGGGADIDDQKSQQADPAPKARKETKARRAPDKPAVPPKANKPSAGESAKFGFNFDPDNLFNSAEQIRRRGLL